MEPEVIQNEESTSTLEAEPTPANETVITVDTSLEEEEEDDTNRSSQLSQDCRDVIDQEVYSWVMAQQGKNKVVTSNHIRQKAYEIGRQYDQYFKASVNWYNKWKKKVNYEEQPEIDALRNRKRAYTAAFKLHAVQRSAELLSISQASLELNVSRRCLQRWKDEVDVITSVAERASNAVYRRSGQGRKVSDSTLDGKLVEWVEESWKNGQQLSSSNIRQKAKEFSTNPEFKASLGWFMKWQKRHNVNLKERQIDSPITKSVESLPLKLRLLPDGQQCAYSDRMVHTRKRKRAAADSMGRIESEQEFDRLLLTWLVECWDLANVVTERMLRDKASELTTNPDFRPTKTWLTEWMKKYNVSLENQTFGMAGETEGEIVEESQVYDDMTVQEHSPLTPTKEEAATALASLAAEGDPGGLEIAEALHKLASAFGLNQDESSKDAMVQHLAILTEQITSQSSSPAALPVVSAPTYLLDESVVQLGTEDVISEEIVTDDATVYDETTAAAVAQSSATTVVPEVQVVMTDVTSLPSQYQPVDTPLFTSYSAHIPMNSVAYQTEVATSSQLSKVTPETVIVGGDSEEEVLATESVIIEEEALLDNLNTIDDHVVLMLKTDEDRGTAGNDSWEGVAGLVSEEGEGQKGEQEVAVIDEH